MVRYTVSELVGTGSAGTEEPIGTFHTLMEATERVESWFFEGMAGALVIREVVTQRGSEARDGYRQACREAR